MPEIENVNTPAASTAAPDLSSMSQPGSQAAAPSTMESAIPIGANNATAANAAAYGEPGAASEPSTVVPAGKPTTPVNVGGHTKLLALIQGMADGLAGASAGLASKGRVSGAEVVQNLESQRAEQQQRATAAAQTQKNAELQNQLTTGQINEMNVKNHILGQTWHDEVDKSHFDTEAAQTKLAGDQFNLFAGTGMNSRPNQSTRDGRNYRRENIQHVASERAAKRSHRRSATPARQPDPRESE